SVSRTQVLPDLSQLTEVCRRRSDVAQGELAGDAVCELCRCALQVPSVMRKYPSGTIKNDQRVVSRKVRSAHRGVGEGTRKDFEKRGRASDLPFGLWRGLHRG